MNCQNINHPINFTNLKRVYNKLFLQFEAKVKIMIISNIYHTVYLQDKGYIDYYLILKIMYFIDLKQPLKAISLQIADLFHRELSSKIMNPEQFHSYLGFFVKITKLSQLVNT